ncbi:unnamed protein product [Trifolium pratense]|uniref:Uncharacterized protein n=1 Tax=Trifolium pratense TaxID=57577 RepID=A0ACB0M5M5_TRIPR|nr:unnamed protein product [Trifolium pratense]
MDENTSAKATTPLDLPPNSMNKYGSQLDSNNNLEDKVLFETGGNDSGLDSRPKRTIRKPFWTQDFVLK